MQKVMAAEQFGMAAAAYLLDMVDEHELEQDYVEYTNLEYIEALTHNWKLQ